MATITLKGNPITTSGDLPRTGTAAPAFALSRADLQEAKLADFAGKTVILNIFPSIDTPVCATSVRRFNQEAASRANTVVLCISRDLPFALGRFCGAEGLERVIPLSDFRHGPFGQVYGVAITSGPIAGLLARAVVVIGPDGRIRHAELVHEIAQEPDYAKVLQAL